MATFTFFLDQKCTVWERVILQVDADSLEQAKELVKPAFDNPVEDQWPPQLEVAEYETLHDSQIHMTLEENHGKATRELIYSSNGHSETETILTNEKDPKETDEKALDDIHKGE